jgi:transcriptional regulator with XRE-family HTH domain
MINSFHMTTTIDFGQWLQSELDNQKINQADLAKRSGLGTGSVSRLINGSRGVGKKACKKLASGLRLPLEVVLRAADILPEDPEIDERAEIIYHRVQNMPDDMLAQVETFINFIDNHK